jgi:hypothetical protein
LQDSLKRCHHSRVINELQKKMSQKSFKRLSAKKREVLHWCNMHAVALLVEALR